jgi:multidrug transporter EmrE-like cation transporter
MNVGVIVLGSLVGVFMFNEKLSFTNKIGLVLAVISILLIAYL